VNLGDHHIISPDLSILPQIKVFLLPQGASMPLHDHPGVTVFSKLLVGSAHVVSHDWVRPPLAVAGGSVVSLARNVLDDEFTAASGAWVLFPNAGGNLRRFRAGEDGPSALLDVMTPSYSLTSKTQERFAFYKDFPYELHPSKHFF
jgi:cysteamine dioxygenase